MAAIAIPRLSGFNQRAKVSADEASARTIQSAISIADAEGAIDLQATTAPTVAEIKTAVIPEFLAEVPESQQYTADADGWAITISGAAGSRTVTVQAALAATADDDWENQD